MLRALDSMIVRLLSNTPQDHPVPAVKVLDILAPPDVMAERVRVCLNRGRIGWRQPGRTYPGTTSAVSVVARSPRASIGSRPQPRGISVLTYELVQTRAVIEGLTSAP